MSATLSSSGHEHCCVPQCVNDRRKQPELSFHTFPIDEELRKLWIQKIRRDPGPKFKISRSTYVCSEHFSADDFKRSLAGKKLLKKGTFPSKFKWTRESAKRKSPTVRSFPVADKAGSSVIPEDSTVSQSDHTYSENDGTSKRLRQSVHELEAALEERDEELKKQLALVEKLRQELTSTRFGLERFSNDNKLIKFYTGFTSYKVLITVFNGIKPTAETMKRWSQVQRERSDKPPASLRLFGKSESLQLVDQYFLFLVYVKQGLFQQDLADRFGVSVSTVSRVILTWANLLYFTLGSMGIWPTRGAVDRHMPDCFKAKYPTTRVIIDCTELKAQTPSNLGLHSESYSHYKSHVTFKGLVGIAPHGPVTFVSNLFTGSVSDKEITRQSGLIELIEPRESVMADKGFLIGDLLRERQAVLNIPPFLTHERAQFERNEVEETQEIARLRIHVERLIRQIKEYHIFDTVIPLSLAGSINQIWSVCCMLTNFMGPLF